MKSGWKKQFRQKIRTRGKEYAYSCVKDFVEDEKGFSATVRGREDYQVFVSADYSAMSCSCPYAKAGKHCKHMAATLYYKEILEDEEKEKKRLAAEKAKRQKLRLSVREDKEKYGIDGSNLLMHHIPSVSEWKKDVNDLIRRYKNENGHIGYWEADDFIDELLKYFSPLYSLVSVCEDEKAIDASIWLYKRIHNVGVDDSSTGCMGHFEDAEFALWTELSEYAKKNFERIETALQAVQNKGQAVYDFLKIEFDASIDFEWEDGEEQS